MSKKKFPYTGKDIARATDGYVNSGVLRMWVSEGRLTAGGRASRRGGPRTFSRSTVCKAVVMAELRKCGVTLDQAEKVAGKLLATLKKIQNLDTASDKEGMDAAMLDLPLYFAINPKSGKATPITGRNMSNKFETVMDPFGTSVSIINVLKILGAANEALNVTQASEGWDWDAEFDAGAV